MKNKLDQMFESDFIRVPRPFIRRFNLNIAVMLAEIYSEYTYWKDRDGLQNGGWFYSTIENITHNTGLSKHQQSMAVKELETYGIIKVKYHGMPKKRFFKFDSTVFGKLYNDFSLNTNGTEEKSEAQETIEGSVEVPCRNFSGFSF